MEIEVNIIKKTFNNLWHKFVKKRSFYSHRKCACVCVYEKNFIFNLIMLGFWASGRI